MTILTPYYYFVDVPSVVELVSLDEDGHTILTPV
jgi:hypothetical protein